MQIKSTREKPLTSASRRWWRRNALIAGYTMAVLVCGMYVHARVNLGDVYRKVRELPDVIYAKARSSARAEPERISISIKLKNYEKLAQQRRTALQRNILLVDDEDVVPATIEHDGVSIPVKIRLKGDIVRDHVGDPHKWSFRIKAEDENTLFGMKQFSIHHPKARKYIYEWIYHEALRREEILALRYMFIHVVLNRRDLGIYALEEHFEKRLIEHGKRREGPIVRFNEGPAWEEMVQQPFPQAKANGVGSYLVTEIDTFHSQQWTATPEQREIHNRAISMLGAFRSGEKTASEVFDVERLALFFAISDLMGAQHGTEWKNIRFYFNPITARLEPIGFDGNGWLPSEGLCFMLKDRHGDGSWRDLTAGDLYQQLFKDQAFFERYLQKLNYVSQAEYLDKLLAELDDQLQQNLDIIRMEDPLYEYSPEVLYDNQRYIRSVLNPVRGIIAYFQRSSDNELMIQLGNPHYLPATIVDATLRTTTLVPSHAESALEGKVDGAVVPFKALAFKLPEGLEWKDDMLLDLRVRYKVAGTDTVREATVAVWPYLDAEKLATSLTQKLPNTHEFQFLATDEERKQIVIAPGEWQVSQDLVIPAGYTVRCDGGTKLNLEKSAAIVSYSPLDFNATSDQPIVIRSADGTGQGVIVMNARARSVLNHVVFQNLAAPSRPGWGLTGSVTFYESPVVLSHCQFVESKCEDALNTIRSTFLITECSIGLAQADAFRADFCEGRIEKSSFSNTGSGCIELVGSKVEIEEVQMKQPVDEGLGVSEHSMALIEDVTIQGGKIGLAVMDSSEVTVRGLNLSSCQYGIAAFRKKLEFGPVTGNIRFLQMQSVTRPYLIQAGSEIVLEGEMLQPAPESVGPEVYQDL
jgi:hypothetical protein